MDKKQKLLFCGDVEGKLDALFKKVDTINKKSGPFDSLFCVGNFFGINNREFEAYKKGDKKIPIETYILGPTCADHVDLYPLDESVEMCPNLHYLGKKGIFTNTQGVKIAYVSGIAAPKSSESPEDFEYTSKDVQEVYDNCVKGNPSFRGIDVLLTSQWPAEITNKDTSEKKVSPTPRNSNLLSWLSVKLKPRYHISGLEGIFYERPPFRSPNLGDHDTTLDLVTRFMGLARVVNPEKSKWIYALNLTPLEHMKIGELLQKTTDETECPYDMAKLEQEIFNKKRPKESGQYFYDTNPVEEMPKKWNKRQKVEFDQSKCWFCLSSPSVEKHLIVTVGNSVYLALAKGGIVEEHFLVCPIEHHQNTLKLPKECLEEIQLFKEALRKFYARNGLLPVFFERNWKTSHMQLQAIPIPKQALRELKEIFLDEAQAQGIQLQELDPENRLDQVVRPNVPYFSVELPNSQILYTQIKGNFPLNFAREVLASGPILNMPEKSDWRECSLGKDAEEKLVRRIRTDFEPFDVTTS